MLKASIILRVLCVSAVVFFLSETHPGRRNIFHAFLQFGVAMLMGPEGWKQGQRTFFGLNCDILEHEFGCSAGAGDVVEVPQGNQLAIGKVMTASIDMPVIIFTFVSALYGITHILERSPKKGKRGAKFPECRTQRLEQRLVNILPVFLVTDYDIGGFFYALVLLYILTDTALVLILRMRFEAPYHFTTHVDGQGVFLQVNKTAGFDFFNGLQGLSLAGIVIHNASTKIVFGSVVVQA